jgi:hypothetical protein
MVYLQIRERGPIYSLMWSRGYSIATSAIRVIILLHPWMQPTLNCHKWTHHIAPVVLVCMLSKDEAVWWKWATDQRPWAASQSDFEPFSINLKSVHFIYGSPVHVYKVWCKLKFPSSGYGHIFAYVGLDHFVWSFPNPHMIQCDEQCFPWAPGWV